MTRRIHDAAAIRSEWGGVHGGELVGDVSGEVDVVGVELHHRRAGLQIKSGPGSIPK